MFKPLNRHVQIEFGAEKTNETTTGILLPQDFKPTEERYTSAIVVSASEDVRFSESIEKGTQIIVDKTMVEVINFGDKCINVILENYILGIIS
tara:strand:- start:306 stop:584 length:279 start_codon:yes stop_codon:yes gene_type:complete